MPIETIQERFHIRRKINAHVRRNLARLWDLGSRAQSHQDILDGLHPWGESHRLKFDNHLPFLFAALALLTFMIGLMIQSHLSFFWSFLLCLMYVGLYFATYESKRPLQEVIVFLEQQVMTLKYQLHFKQLPKHFPIHAQSLLILSQLKQSFPLFNLGNVSNQITEYASTVWQNQEHRHQVLVFKYHYVNEAPIHNQQKDPIKLKQIEEYRWGVFVFQVPALGIAVTNKRRAFEEPFTERWHSSDIYINQQLRIFGQFEQQLAHNMTPAFSLKLSDFFNEHQGDLIYHHEKEILCFLGKKNLFEAQQHKTAIEEVSHLRGHLRTLRLAHYEKLKTDLIQLLQEDQ